MADKYQRWNDWAPRYIADLAHDFGLKPEIAAAIPGNFAAESGYFNLLQELRPLVSGSRGGYGHAQWTGLRRVIFEAWLKRKGWKADSYEANYSMLYREMKGSHKHVLERLKKATSLENAAWIVGKYYEAPAVLNLNPRIKAAKEALELYRKNPVKPTVWPTDKDEPMPTAPTTVPVPVPVAPDTSRPAVPWYKSLVFTGATGGLGASLVAIAQAYQPGVPFLNQLDTLAPLIIAAVATFAALVGRVTSTAQPLTATQGGADKIGAAQAAAVAVVAADNVQHGRASVQPVHEAWDGTGRTGPDLSPAERAAGWTTVRPEMVPMTQLSLDQLSQEMPEVAEKLVGLVSSVVPLLGTISKVADLGKALNDTVRRP